MTMTTFLMPQFSSQKSFYNKARVRMNDNEIDLISYNTLVAKIKKGKLEIYNLQSQTTIRHINEFIQQNGFGKMSKKELEVFYKD